MMRKNNKGDDIFTPFFNRARIILNIVDKPLPPIMVEKCNKFHRSFLKWISRAGLAINLKRPTINGDGDAAENLLR